MRVVDTQGYMSRNKKTRAPEVLPMSSDSCFTDVPDRSSRRPQRIVPISSGRERFFFAGRMRDAEFNWAPLSLPRARWLHNDCAC
jgi:hypothetical protein